nr:hypothetical protein [Tanacetum cinerariifolium]
MKKPFQDILHRLGEFNPTHAFYNGSKTGKDNEDPRWSTSFKIRRTQKTSSALEDFICLVFVHDRNIKSLTTTATEIQDEDVSPFENTSKIPMEVVCFKLPQEEVIPIRRSARTHRAPNRLCLNVEVEEHSLRDLNEPTNYKAAMLDPKYDKWLDAMNAEMQFMKDNQVWCLVDLPLMVFTQTYMVDYEETFSPVADIRAIKIPIAIAAFYDYEIWLQSVKTYLRKCFAMKDLGEATFILGIKIYWDRSKRLIRLSQNACMDKILKRYRMDNSKHGSIMYAVRCTRPDVAFAQNITSHFQHNLGEPHWIALKTILKYLKYTKDMFLVYGGNPEAEHQVDCYCDARFKTNRDDIKSQTGYVFVLNRGAVDWKSSKQSPTLISSTEQNT